MDFLLALHQLVLPKLRAGNSSPDGTNLAQATISICYKNMCVPFGIWDLKYGIWDLGFGIRNLDFGIWDLEFWNWEVHLWMAPTWLRQPLASTARTCVCRLEVKYFKYIQYHKYTKYPKALDGTILPLELKSKH